MFGKRVSHLGHGTWHSTIHASAKVTVISNRRCWKPQEMGKHPALNKQGVQVPVVQLACQGVMNHHLAHGLYPGLVVVVVVVSSSCSSSRSSISSSNFRSPADTEGPLATSHMRQSWSQIAYAPIVIANRGRKSGCITTSLLLHLLIFAGALVSNPARVTRGKTDRSRNGWIRSRSRSRSRTRS